MLKKIVDYLLHPQYILLWLDNKRIITLNDEKFLKIKFKKVFKYSLNLKNPKTFNEKLQWLKLYDRKDIYTKMVDKYDVKEYVSNIINNEYIIKTLGIYNCFDDIEFDKLPNQFVIKCTHDSGGIIIVKDKTKLNIKKARKKINKHLNRNYYYPGREWPYKNIKPRIIIEEYMGENLNDYKIMCFNGEPYYSFVCTDRNSSEGLHVTFFDDKWIKMNFERHYPSSNKKIDKPINYDKMLELSRILSKNIPFVRVDWYEINNKIYFGELTFFPGSGFEEFTPEEWDYKLGDLIDLEGVK